jgi:hypothetical protein
MAQLRHFLRYQKLVSLMHEQLPAFENMQSNWKAIMVANIGFNPMNNGDLIIISVPPLEDRRRDRTSKSRSRGR